VKETGKVIEEV